MSSRTTMATIGVVVAAVLAACGDDDESTNSTAPVATTLAPLTAAEFNDADVAFAQGMIPHHQQAIEMATMALDPNTAAGDGVVELATRIQAAQGPEIELMTGWLNDWGAPTAPGTTDGHAMPMNTEMASADGMMSAEEMEQLAGESGTEFDRMWLEMMIRHHQGAIAMANEEMATGSNPEAVELGGKIVAAQEAEIDEMNALLGQ